MGAIWDGSLWSTFIWVVGIKLCTGFSSILLMLGCLGFWGTSWLWCAISSAPGIAPGCHSLEAASSSGRLPPCGKTSFLAPSMVWSWYWVMSTACQFLCLCSCSGRPLPCGQTVVPSPFLPPLISSLWRPSPFPSLITCWCGGLLWLLKTTRDSNSKL